MVHVVGYRARTAINRSRRITGLAPDVIAELMADIAPLRHERHQAVLAARLRRRAVGAGARHKLVFVDRLLATLVNLRHGVTHDVLACWIAHLKNWRALTRHHGHREHMADTAQAVAGPHSHQQTATLSGNPRM